MAIKSARPDDRKVAPHLMLHDVNEAIGFYEKALGARVLYKSELPDGRIVHAQMQIADSVVLMTWENLHADDENIQKERQMARSPRSTGATTVMMELYVDDVDAAFQRAIDAGGKAIVPVQDMFYGDRSGYFEDPFGHVWSLATVVETLTPEQVTERAMALFA